MTGSAYSARVRADPSLVWGDKQPLLGRLDFELTERCNNNCIHCYINLPADDLEAKERELSTREIRHILEEAASLGCLAVRFSGGEPLLREDFEELYLFARRLGLKVLLFTNATLLTPHLAELFARIPPLQKLEVTIYGMRQTSYEAVSRTPGSFDAAWRGINLLLENEIPFVVKSALLPPNQGEMRQFEAWASTLPWMEGPPSYSTLFDLRCRRDSLISNRRIRKLRLPPQEACAVLSKDGEQYLRGMKAFCSKFMVKGPLGDRLFTCTAATQAGCVDAYGRLQPCMMLRHPDAVYDLRQGSLKEAVTRFWPQVRQWRASSLDYLRRCGRCFLRSLCDQCPAKSWMEHGSLDTPVVYYCEVTHALARHLLLLEEGEQAWEVEDWTERLKHFCSDTPDLKENDLG